VDDEVCLFLKKRDAGAPGGISPAVLPMNRDIGRRIVLATW